MDNKYYVYCLVDVTKPGDYTFGGYNFKFKPFYIGKGSGNRMNQHFELGNYKLGKTYKERKIRKLIMEGHKPDGIIIEQGLSEQSAFELEVYLIRLIGRYPKGPLTNGTDGGEGSSGYIPKTKGLSYDEIYGPLKAKEIKDKLSKITKGKTLEDIHGVLKGKEIKEKISKFTPSRKGVKLSDETKKKISQSLIGNKRHKGCNHSKETKMKISEAKKGKLSWNAKPILQLDGDTVIKEWRSAKHAAEQLGLSQGNIWSVLNGKRKRCGNYKWKLK